MKLTETKLRSIIREELSKITEKARTGVDGRRSKDPNINPYEEIRVFAKANPEAGRYGGAESIEVFVRPDGRGGFEYIDAMAPPGEAMGVEAFERDYADIMVREIENGNYLDETTEYYSPREIEKRLNY